MYNQQVTELNSLEEIQMASKHEKMFNILGHHENAY